MTRIIQGNHDSPYNNCVYTWHACTCWLPVETHAENQAFMMGSVLCELVCFNMHMIPELSQVIEMLFCRVTLQVFLFPDTNQVTSKQETHVWKPKHIPKDLFCMFFSKCPIRCC